MGRPALAALSLLAMIGMVSETVHGTARPDRRRARHRALHAAGRGRPRVRHQRPPHRDRRRGEQPAHRRLAARAPGAGGDAVRPGRRRPAPDAGGDRGRQDLRRARRPTDEDVAIAQSSIAWAKALGPRATLTLSGAYYEAFQAPAKNLVDASERRDFRSLASTVQLGWIAAERFDLSLIAGYRSFLFKPDRDDDFNAPTAAVELRWTRQTDAGRRLGGEHRRRLRAPDVSADRR